MASKEDKAILSQSVFPVILGNGLRAHRLSARLYRTFGVESLLCGRRQNLWDLLFFHCGFLRLFEQNDPTLAARQLAALSDEYGDCLFVLIPLCSRQDQWIDRNRELLTSRFVISSVKELFQKVPFSPFSKGETTKGIL